MQKMIRSYASRMLVPASFSLALLLSGCGGTMGDKNTDEAKQYEVAMALDAGEYDKAIALLSKDCGGFDYAECQLNLGSAYLGKAGMDIISLGRELVKIDGNTTATDAQKDTQTMTVLFDIITDPSIAVGAAIYKNLLDSNGTECNGADYPTLTEVQKQACIAVNPILLQELLAEDTNQETEAVDIATIVQFKDVLDAAVPGITTAEIVSILDNSTPDASKDVNSNTDIDSMEATDCAINAKTNGTFDNTCTSDTSVTAIDMGVKDFTNVTETLYGVNVTVTSNTTYDDGNFTRFVTDIGGGTYSTVTTSGYCQLDGTTTCSEGEADCYPCPTFNADGTLATLSGSVTNVLNNDDLLTSIALMSDSDTTKTSDEKVADFKNDVCNVTGTADATNTGNCTWDATENKLVIDQSALIDYMAK